MNNITTMVRTATMYRRKTILKNKNQTDKIKTATDYIVGDS